VADREPPEIDWARIYVQAVNLAADVTKRDAQDVVKDAVALYLAGQAPYDPAEGKTLAEHLVHIGLTARAKRRRTERRRKKRGMMGKLIHLFDRPPPTSEERYADAEEEHRKAGLFERVLVDPELTPEERARVLLAQEDVHEPIEQASQSGMNIETVRNARKRLKRRLAALAESDDEETE
jgi:DNA-directed RNA polymerase specialized sigma24 family protein